MREPIGLVDGELLNDGSVVDDWAGGRLESWDEGVFVEGELAVELLEATDVRLPARLGSCAVAKVAILIPLLVFVLAGIKRVVWLLDPGIEMRWGWFVEQHPVVSCVPVE